MRCDHRAEDALRPIRIQRHFTRTSPGSVLIQAGGTSVLCTVNVSTDLPPWMDASKGSGWLTAEYNMLPGSTCPRKKRDREGKLDGRTSEIQRFIGRSLRAVMDMKKLGPRLVTVDCDVLEADGGTRTLSVTGAVVALVDALCSFEEFFDGKKILKDFPLRDTVAAVSVGMVEGKAVLDLCYQEDFTAAVDMNVVMTGGGQFVEIQGTGEKTTFDEKELASMLALAKKGISELTVMQKTCLGEDFLFEKT
ncbi:MAG: ribonuclease PH [Planctomycetia bacterium]|nr:ribonuclease PH [Planctomycetia bacterium]